MFYKSRFISSSIFVGQEVKVVLLCAMQKLSIQKNITLFKRMFMHNNNNNAFSSSVYNNVNSSVTILVVSPFYILSPCVIISFVIFVYCKIHSPEVVFGCGYTTTKNGWFIFCLHIAQKKQSYNLNMLDMYIVMAIAETSQVIANVTPPTDHVK